MFATTDFFPEYYLKKLIPESPRHAILGKALKYQNVKLWNVNGRLNNNVQQNDKEQKIFFSLVHFMDCHSKARGICSCR